MSYTARKNRLAALNIALILAENVKPKGKQGTRASMRSYQMFAPLGGDG